MIFLSSDRNDERIYMPFQWNWEQDKFSERRSDDRLWPSLLSALSVRLGRLGRGCQTKFMGVRYGHVHSSPESGQNQTRKNFVLTFSTATFYCIEKKDFWSRYVWGRYVLLSLLEHLSPLVVIYSVGSGHHKSNVVRQAKWRTSSRKERPSEAVQVRTSQWTCDS